MKPFQDQVALITGASSGIGRAVAEELARQGADCVLLARREERLADVVTSIERMGRRGVAVAGDVSRDGDLERAVERAHSELGPVSVALANAGFGVSGTVYSLTVDDYRRQLETNVLGVVRTVLATREDLCVTSGVVGILGSVAGRLALPGVSPYSASKAALQALADSWRHELGRRGVGVVLVLPGFVRSEIRQVDNEGVYRSDRKDTIPSWLAQPTDRAARTIVRGLRRRRPVQVVTGHGRLLLLLDRLAPAPTRWLVGRLMAPKRSRDR